MARMSRSPRLVIAVLFLAGFAQTSKTVEAAEEVVTTFYVVRHAERPDSPDGGNDPPLTVTGMRRAEGLRDTLRGIPIAAVYSTRTLRTWQTAMPTATRAGVSITPYADNPEPAFFADLRAKHAGQGVLIVGHANTVRDIVSGLGGDPDGPIGDSFDNLFVVTHRGSAVETARRKYPVIETIGRPEFAGVSEPNDLSAIAAGPKADDLVVGSDEGSAIQVLGKAGNGYGVRSTIELGMGQDNDKEFDIEGIARHGTGPAYYVVGSHARRRKNIFRKEDEGASLGKIRERFEDQSPDREKSREVLIRLDIDPETGKPVTGSLKRSSLHDMLDENRVLGPFSKLAATENGVDIEGIASDGERLYVGFRGPVLRFGFAIVVAFKPETPQENKLLYLRLDGRGIRDLARVHDGFLVIAGPTGDSTQSCQLYHWDGNSELPGARGATEPPPGLTTLLGNIPPAPGAPNAEPEGIVVLKDEPGAPYEILIVYDGVAGGSPTSCRVARP